MEYVQVLFPTRVIILLVPHDSLDDKPPRIVNSVVMDLLIDNTRGFMPLPPSSLPDLGKVELGIKNLDLTQGTSPRPSLEVPTTDQVKPWDSTIELTNKFPTSLTPVDESLVPSLCLDPPLCPQVIFESKTMLACPCHGQPFWIGQFDFLWHCPTLVSHMVPLPSMSLCIETLGLCLAVGTL